MSDVTRILSAIKQSDTQAAKELLPFVYEELRRLASQYLAAEKPGQTLQATALVHEAYLRLVVSGGPSVTEGQHWNSRGHFYAAAAEAMHRILVEEARRKQRPKHGGDRRRVDFAHALCLMETPSDDILALDDALTRLETVDPVCAKVVKLRFIAGLTMPETADFLGIPLRTAERNWTYARTWLRRDLSASHPATYEADH